MTDAPRLDRDPRARRALLAELASAAALVLVLDHDGTLAPFAPRPEDAKLPGPVRHTLARLASIPATTVVISSGRSPASLDDALGGLDVRRFAEHGLWERPVGGAWRATRRVDRDWVGAARARLLALVAAHPGAWCEERTASLVFHHRPADPPLGAEAVASVRAALAGSLPDGVELLEANMALELRVRGPHKGAVVSALRGELAGDGTRWVAIGDDPSDEQMFAALPDDGVAVVVGARPSCARFRLADPDAVAHWLVELASARGAVTLPKRG